MLPISGLFDLRPLVDSFANEWLSFTPEQAAELSPLLQPRGTVPAVIAVAENDGTGFREQAREFTEHWREGAGARELVVADRHHYDVFCDLTDPRSELVAAVCELAGAPGPEGA